MGKVTKGNGVRVAWSNIDDNGAPTGLFTDFARVRDINGVEVEAENIETSNMDSPTGDDGQSWKEHTAGWADIADVDLKIQFLKSDAASVYGLFRKDLAYKVTFIDGSIWQFNGYCKKFGQEVEREKIVTTNFTIKGSGKPAFTAAT